MCHIMVLRLFNASKSCVFRKTTKKDLIDSISLVESSYKFVYVRRSCEILIFEDNCEIG